LQCCGHNECLFHIFNTIFILVYRWTSHVPQ
jgi:hypothetical protein